MAVGKKISVIIPIYNSEKYLEKCLLSIINQTYNNLEIILINDGSSDSSGKICDVFAKKDKRIIVIHKKNGGQNSARKAGIDNASGEYISFIDSDDWIDLDYYETLQNNLHNADIVTSGIIFEEEAKKYISYDGLEPKYYNNMEYVLKNFFIYHEGSGAGLNNNMVARLWKSSIVKKIANKVDIGTRIGEDWFFSILFMLQAKTINIIRYAGYHYIMRTESAMHSKYDNFLSDQNVFYLAVRDSLKNFYLESEMLYDFQIRFLKGIIENIPIFFNFDIKNQIDFDSSLMKLLPNRFDVKKLSDQNHPLIKRFSNKKICLFGAGKLGRYFFNMLFKVQDIHIVLWVDNNPMSNMPLYTVSDPNLIKEYEFDYILVAVANEQSFKQIKEQLITMGVSEGKILWQNNILDK